MENQKTGPAPAPAPRQLSLALDCVTLRGISPPERTVIIVRLARILLEAAGARSRPLVEALEPWLREKLALVSQKSRLAEAIRYALSRWTGLCLFLAEGLGA